MEHRDTLLTIAELAVALAGFASIVSVVGQRGGATRRAADALRIRLMLEVALRNAAFAVMPLPFLAAYPNEPALWRVFSGLYLMVALVYAYFRLDDTRRTGPRWSSVSTQVLLALTALVAIANVIGLGGPYTFSLYAANVLGGLAVSGITFLAVAGSALGFEDALED